jgi:hypothetical protein
LTDQTSDVISSVRVVEESGNFRSARRLYIHVGVGRDDVDSVPSAVIPLSTKPIEVTLRLTGAGYGRSGETPQFPSHQRQCQHNCYCTRLSKCQTSGVELRAIPDEGCRVPLTSQGSCHFPPIERFPAQTISLQLPYLSNQDVFVCICVCAGVVSTGYTFVQLRRAEAERRWSVRSRHSTINEEESSTA